MGCGRVELRKNRTIGRSRMSIGRRETSNLRRRRLLVYQSSRDDTAETAAERRQFEKMREARRPTEIYGTSVNRMLRGRWFSLVPVRRRAMAGVTIAIVGVAALLCLGHWVAVAWQPLAYRPELARPLRLDRPDSFGAWVRAAFLAAAAGTSLLVYQLRRYRNDDFRGSYRIWPPVIALMILASLDAVCQMVPWGGELIELVLGRRVALAGSDWIRIALTVGGIALAMRMVAEVRHSKLAMIAMLSAILGFAIPMAARWGMLASDTPVRWLVITSSPMMASAAVWVACGAYLRKLFREVRKMDAEDTLNLRIEQWRERFAAMRLASKRDKELAVKTAKEAATARKSAKAAVKKVEKSDTAAALPRPAVAKAGAAPDDVAVAASATAKPSQIKNSDKGEPGAEQKAGEGKKSRFSLRFWRRSEPADVSRVEPSNVTKSEPAAVPAPAKISTPVATAAKPALATVQNVVANNAIGRTANIPDAAAGRDAKPKKGGLFGWFGKKQETANDSAGGVAAVKPNIKPSNKPTTQKSQSDDEDESGEGDDPSIDWSSMGKAERRRLRRKIKRGGQAA